MPPESETQGREVPPLPDRESQAERWHPRVIEWWESVWRSPMASEYVGPDLRGGLYALAELYQQRWLAKTAKELVAIVSEIRLQEVRFGLSPIDRRRLQWEIAKVDEASEKTAKRAKRRAKKAKATKDPRKGLKLA